MANYKELSAQIAALMQQAENARKTERAAAIAEIRSQMSQYGITIADLNITDGRGRRAGGARVVPAKYRHPKTGETWSGRGLKPRWLVIELSEGKTLEEFLLR